MIDSLKETHPKLFEIDQQLHRLVRKIELLNYVNPINIEDQKRQFFAHRFSTEPNFRYRKIDFDPHLLQRELYSLKIDEIEDEASYGFYKEVIDEYAALIKCIETIGQGKKFYYNSLRSFGTPTQRDVENARFILHFEDEPYNNEMFPVYGVEEAEAYFKEFTKRYGFKFKIKLSTKLSAAAMVLNNTQTLVLKKNHRFSANQLKVLANHEIGVHMVTTFNGMRQPVQLFFNGFPNNVETQEGLAVMSEYMSDCLTLYRLKELAYRVLAVDSLLKGYDFCDTFDLLHAQYKLNKDEAFSIALRVHRGGGYTKDYLYLTGLKKVYDFYHRGEDMNTLLTGKVTLEHKPLIDLWLKEGIALAPKYENHAFEKNDNTNTKIDFILQNLK
ncbi:flavohemoglobin expression-modulating QEGLA motif protein [Gilvibacter sp.]|uniref:flavohemoglobin expression-modulating QEGLA motif protein n=1 Tax=Gilvibacter sp. TaxID=2729997 RepID=UPI003B5204CF